MCVKSSNFYNPKWRRKAALKVEEGCKGRLRKIALLIPLKTEVSSLSLVKQFSKKLANFK